MPAPPTGTSTALDGHQRLADELSGKIDDSGDHDGGTAAEEGGPDGRPDRLRPYATVRERLARMVHSYKYQTFVIAFVILDCICVIGELLIDLEIASSKGSHTVKTVLHSISIAIMSLFLLELPAKLYVYGLEYFTMPWELFDAFVVIVSFALDVAFRHAVGPVNGAGLIIVLRLWRVTRILNGMVMSVRRHSEHRLQEERQSRCRAERELAEWRAYCRRLEHRLREEGLQPPDGRPEPISAAADITER